MDAKGSGKKNHYYIFWYTLYHKQLLLLKTVNIIYFQEEKHGTVSKHDNSRLTMVNILHTVNFKVVSQTITYRHAKFTKQYKR